MVEDYYFTSRSDISLKKIVDKRESVMYNTSRRWSSAAQMMALWCSRLARQPVTLEVDGSSPATGTRKPVDALHRRFFNEINPFGFVKSPSAVKYGYAM